eukprot:5501694-Prymnesium_polylepis.1
MLAGGLLARPSYRAPLVSCAAASRPRRAPSTSSRACCTLSGAPTGALLSRELEPSAPPPPTAAPPAPA